MSEALPHPPIPPDPNPPNSVEVEMLDSPNSYATRSLAGANSSSSAASGSLGPESGFNWAKNLSSVGKIPESNVPVTFSDSGRPRVKVSNAVFERGAKLHSDYIVGIFYGKPPSYGKIWGVLNYLWGKDKRVSIHHLTKNAFLFHIPSSSLRKKILQHELWRVGDSPFFVTEWRSEFSLNPPSLDRAPVWTTINGIPFDLITPEGLGIVCRPLGKAVDFKPFKSISSADVKIIVDLTKPLQSEIELERDDGTILLLSVVYPWLPPLCPLCSEIGHKEALCPRVYGPENKPRKSTKNSPAKDPPKASAPVSSQSSEKRKEKEPTTTAPKSAWKPVATPSASSPASTATSQAPQVTSPLAIIPVTAPSQDEIQSSDKGLGSMELIVVDKPFTPAPKTLSTKTRGRLTSIIPTTSNSFDILQDDSLALIIPDTSQLESGLLPPNSVQKKKRKVNSSSLIFSRDDPPITGEMRHNP